MKRLLSIILLAAALAASSAAGQTVKSLGYNTTNGNIVAATNVTFTNSVGFATNARAATRTNLGGTTVGNAVFTATNAAAAATAVGLNWSALTNAQSALYSGQATRLLGYAPEIAAGSTNPTGFNVLAYTNTNGLVIPANILIGEDQTSGGPRNVRNVTVNGAVTIQYPFSSPTTIYGNNSILATDASTYTNTLATWNSNTVTFATNVTVGGNISVGSLTTTTPSTWALDATQTAAATNGRLTLPSNANVIRLTNNNAISSVTNGVLGAFYYLVNQATNAVTISNVGGITIDGAQNLTLSPNESATLVATGATNVSVAARGDLNNVTLTGDTVLSGVNNTMPNATNAASASSLMTRDLVGQEFANPRTKMQTTYWFGLTGLGEWSLIGSGALSAYVALNPGFGGGRSWNSSHMVGTNHSGAGLRLGNDGTFGAQGQYRFSDGGALTMRGRIRRQDTIGVPALAFLMGERTATQMWQQNAYGLYFVPQPTNSWASNAVATQHDRISVSNVVWAVNTAGTNGPTEPTWTDLIGSLVTNGSAVYRNLGPHTSNNWVLGIGSTNASQVVMTNTGKAGLTRNSRSEVVLKLRIDGTTNTPYTVYGTVENNTGESTEVSLTTTNNADRQPQFWNRLDDPGTRTNVPYDLLIKYFSIDGTLNPL